MQKPETRYARSGPVSIAYQLLGDGVVDLVLVPGFVSHVEVAWEEPRLARFLARLASFSRLIVFDKRGTGMSDPVLSPPSMDQRMDDITAVMDAAGSARAAIFGVSEGGTLSLLFAQAHAERARALILYGSWARRLKGFFRPGYLNHLASSWIPALDGVEAKLHAGARVADVGCGHGASTLLLATTYPASTVVGFDADDGSITAARKRAADAGLAGQVSFEVASATSFAGAYDLVCFFDCLHDMGDPAGACAHVRDHLAPGGTLMLIEPYAADDLSGNLNPVGAAYYGFSTLLCTPSSLSQEVGTALGAQAGEARLREIVTGAGFASQTRVAETPFNIVLQARA